jgi:DNA-binding CsgD family transcriptional regulator
MYALHDLGFIMGSVASVAADSALSSPAMIALASVCALSMLALVGTTPRRNVESMTDGNSIELLHQPSMPDDRSVELAEKAVALDEEQERTTALEAKPNEDGAPAAQARQDAPYYVDRLSKQVELMRIDYGLSAREAEVAELLARGETVARIAETLYVSENTVRTHSKRIYAKLDVHKKQQLRDLVESYDPGALS